MSNDRIMEPERRIGELTAELHDLQKASPGTPVPDYTFETIAGQNVLG